jgi:hypothetical protein
MKKISIYLAGNIQKGHENESLIYWTEHDLKKIRETLSFIKITFLNPAIRNDDLSDQKSTFGRDVLQVYSSDLVLVDARERRGLGVGAEMMWAKMNNIPVVTYSPMESHYNKSKVNLLGIEVKDWIHPFVYSLSDFVAKSLDDAIDFIKSFIKGDIKNIKGPGFIKEAMEYYKNTQMHIDDPKVDLEKRGIYV